jgi:hypothetical protein
LSLLVCQFARLS